MSDCEHVTPMRKTSTRSIPKKKVGLPPRQENDASEKLEGHYEPGMCLTTIRPNPVIRVSDSDNSSMGDGDLGVDYAFNSQQERVQISNFESPHFQQRTKSPFSTPSSSVSQKSWILMFQKQQTILQQLLEGQTRLEQRQDSFGDQLAHMTSKVEHSMPTTSSSSNEGKRKRMVTRSLSVSFFLSVKVVTLCENFKPVYVKLLTLSVCVSVCLSTPFWPLRVAIFNP